MQELGGQRGGGLFLGEYGYMLQYCHVHSTLWLTVCGELMLGVGAGAALVSTYSDVLLVTL